MLENKKDYTEMVVARIREESEGQNKETEESKKLPIEFVIDCLNANRLGDATLYTALYRGKFVYVKLWNRWLKWVGNHWEEDIDNELAAAAIEQVCQQYERILIETNDGANEKSFLNKLVKTRCNLLRDVPAREKLLEMTRLVEDPPSIMATDLDCQEYLLACPNGVIDLRTGECLPGQPEQYLLNACPVPWACLDAPSPHFINFLYTSLGEDDEMVRYMLRLLGYGLLGNRDEHIWAIFHGPRGRNGKDTLMKVLFEVMGCRLAIRVPTAMLIG